MALYGVILAGGSGTRFWPLSRQDLPKQLLRLVGARTLLQQSFDRLRGPADPERIAVVTNEVLAARVREQLPELTEPHLIVEPMRRDTALAMGLAAGLLAREDPDAVLAVTPSDHVIRPAAKFRDAIRDAAELARASDAIVTFGIKPRSPATAYGYIRRGAPLQERKSARLPAFEVESFEEKPDRETAQRYLDGGQHYWNSGIFVWTAKKLLAELEQHLPKTHAAIARIADAWSTPERDAVLRAEFEAAERVSIDYAVLEKADRIHVVEVDFEWSDVGSWSALPPLFGQDDHGHTIQHAPVLSLDSKDCLVHGEEGRLVALVGVEGLAVVQTRDATLVCPLEKAEEVKALVARLEDDETLQAYT
jgi:mannose-1-phosphate guanylyltransferase